jgi:hypothetical protein
MILTAPSVVHSQATEQIVEIAPCQPVQSKEAEVL